MPGGPDHAGSRLRARQRQRLYRSGFTPDEAEASTAKSALILALKATLDASMLTQKQAAKVCGTDQPTLSKVLHGRMDSVTIDRLAHWLTALGQTSRSP